MKLFLRFRLLNSSDSTLEADFGVRAIAERLGCRAATTAKGRFLHRDIVSAGVDELEVALNHKRSVIQNLDSDTHRHLLSEHRVFSVVMELPFINESWKINRDDIFDIDGDVVLTPVDLDVVFGNG